VAFRKTFYQSLEQLQQDLDRYVEFYNRERAHQGYRTQGRTPYQAFLDGIAAMPEQREGSATPAVNAVGGTSRASAGGETLEQEVTPEAA